MAIARGQITIVDVNDAKTLNLYLSSNKPLTQIYNKENKSYVPNWTASPFLVITPELFESGNPNSVIGQIKTTPVWKINGSTTLTTFGATAATTAPYGLTIKNNMTSVNQLQVECEVIFVDTLTKVETKVKSSITFSKTENAGQLICAIAYAPQGTIFKNDQSATLKAHCDMWRGSTIDATGVAYSWLKMSNTGTFVALTEGQDGITGVKTNEITIPAAAVLNFETFKCEVKDTDTGSGTYNTTVADVISFADMSDPYQLEIYSEHGNIIKNGTGSLTVKAKVWQNGVLIEDAAATTKFTFTWRKYDQNGALVTSWGTSGVKTGQSLVITSADVANKATFICELALKA